MEFVDSALKRQLRLIVKFVLAVFVIPLAANADQPGILEKSGNIPYKGIYDEPVLLRDGVFEGLPFVTDGTSRPRLELVDRLYVSGDLDGDGSDETAVLLVENSGGSGTLIYLAVVALSGERLRNLSTVPLGDRIQVVSLSIDSAELVVEIVAVGANDPMCCGATKRRLSFGLADNSLVQIDAVETGNLSLADLEDRHWRLVEIARDDPVPDVLEISAVFVDSRISGSAGCNRYFAAIDNTEPYTLSIGTPGATRMLCPQTAMDLEMRYLSLLQKSNRFGFSFGRLALYYQDEDKYERLLFIDRVPTAVQLSAP